MPRLIANMIARNEADRYLAEVLSHLKPIVDDIVLTDDCSTDDTPAVAEAMGAHVYQTPENLFVKDESKLRTLAWSNLSNHADKDTWVLCIDADEKFFPHKTNFPKLLDQSQYHVLGVMFYHIWTEDMRYRADKAWKPNTSQRLFRFFPNGEFLKKKLACGSEPTYVLQCVRRRQYIPNTGFKMQHLGYMRDSDKIAKYKRYMELDGGTFHNLSHIESILDRSPVLSKWRYNGG